MTRKQKKSFYRIIIGAIIFLIGTFLPITNDYLEFVIYILAYAITGGDVIVKAVRNIGRGQIFDENFLMTIATAGAFIVGQFPEGVAVMLFYQVGELFQSVAVSQSRKSISDLMDIRPDYANIEQNGEIVQVDPDEVSIGDIILVKPGEKIPLDGTIVEGSSLLDTKALTGESVPREATIGNEVLSGCINQTGILRIKVEKLFHDSTVSKILDLVENASSKKSKSENFITKFARYYTPCVVIGAALLAVIPPLVIKDALFSEWIHRALIFLVISCPCALVISVPLSFFGGIGGASKQGILVKGSNYLEALSKAEIVVFDKTGTLTKGTFKVTKIQAFSMKPEQLLEYAAMAECYSTHPISMSLREAYGKPIDSAAILDVKEISGQGIKAMVLGQQVAVGNDKLMHYMNNFQPVLNPAGTIIYVAVNQSYVGYIIISDEIKDDAKEAIQSLKANRVSKTVMLTGDHTSIGNAVAKDLGLDEVYTELLPADKVEKVEELLTKKSSKGNLVFVGDGINDAPVLSRADIGIAMGAIGSDAAIEAADVVLMTDEPSKISTAIAIARKTLKIVRQNIIFALGVKAIVLILGALGYASMWAAVFADVGVSVIAILNAMRALNVKDLEQK